MAFDLVNGYITMENDHFPWKHPCEMAIVHSYGNLPLETVKNDVIYAKL